MKGITEERLRYIFRSLYWNKGTEEELLGALINECTELNPWHPIESAPKHRKILLYCEKHKCVIGQFENAGYWYSGEVDDQLFPTHWQELPEDPK